MFIQRLNFKIVEIHFCKTLAKLTGSAVRINSKKPKVNKKKTMKEKKNLKQPRRDLNLHPNFLQRKKYDFLPLGHATTTLDY